MNNVIAGHSQNTTTKLKVLPATIKHLLMAEALGALVLSSIPLAYANPTGGHIAAGSVAIAQQGTHMDINQSSQRAVINWQSFNIDSGEHVSFNQPNRDAATLNRVVGNDPSAILGNMTANGNVYLVNQNGIVVGKNAEINVGSLTATTANIATKDFMDGKLNFTEEGKADARVINHGNITVQQGGMVALVAPGVENNGAITAKLGKITLASGDAFTLDLYGDQLINLTVTKDQLATIPSADGKPLSHYVSNTGDITADGGMVTILAGAGKAIVDNLINLQGHVQAQTVENHNGVITLLGDEGSQIDVSGTLDASGQTPNTNGGKVEIRASEINLKDNSLIDVSGDHNGGTALIGGDLQGSGDGFKAQNTLVAQSAVINADSKKTGDGGKVIVWAENDTNFNGTITARGANNAGNGGLVEVSGKHNLNFDGNVDASANNGNRGELLLDPGNLTVASKAQMQQTKLLGSTGTYSNPANEDNVIDVQKVNYLLQTGTDVSLKTSKNLTVAAQIDGRATNGKVGAGITLTSGNDIAINNNILTNNGEIFINALAGNITMKPNTALVSGNKTIKLNAGGDIQAQHLISTGIINVTSGSQSIFNQSLSGFDNQGIGSIYVDAGGDVIFNGIHSTSDVTIRHADTLDIEKPIYANGQVNLESNSLTIATGADIVSNTGVTNTAAAKELRLTAAGDMLINANLMSGNAPIRLTSQNGTITAGDKIAINSGSAGLTIDAGGNINTGSLCLISDGCGLSTAATIAGDANISSQHGNIALNGSLLADRTVLLTANNGKLDLGNIDLRSREHSALTLSAKNDTNLTGDIVTNNGKVTLLQSGSLSTLAGKRIETGSEAITLNADVAITLHDLLTKGGLSVSSTAGAITFNSALGTVKDFETSALSIKGGSDITFNDQVHLSGINAPASSNVLDVEQTGQGILTINGKVLLDNGSAYLGKPAGVSNFTNSKIELGNSIFLNNGATLTLNNNVHVFKSTSLDSTVEVPHTGDFAPSKYGVSKIYDAKYAKTDSSNWTQSVVDLFNPSGSITISGLLKGLFGDGIVQNLRFTAKNGNQNLNVSPLAKTVTVSSNGKEYKWLENSDMQLSFSNENTMYSLGNGFFSKLLSDGKIQYPQNANTSVTLLGTAAVTSEIHKITVSQIAISGTDLANSTPNNSPESPAQSTQISIVTTGRGPHIMVAVTKPTTGGTTPSKTPIFTYLDIVSDNTVSKPATPMAVGMQLATFNTLSPLASNDLSISQTSIGIDQFNAIATKSSVSDPEKVDVSSPTKQTLSYANAINSTSNKGLTGYKTTDNAIVFISGNSDAESADLGQGSPENGAVQDTFNPKR